MKSNNSFWKNLPESFVVLAPMADVTDIAFRSMFARHGKPDVFWTEFVSANGLCSEGRDQLKVDLMFEENQRPIVAQLFTANPDYMYQAGLIVAELGFDGLDINMGCPDRSIEKQGCGAGMIKDKHRACEVIASAQRVGLPVSVKTRIGYYTEEIDEWLSVLLSSGIEALTVHLRTRQEMSKVPAHWEWMERIVTLRNAIAPDVVLIGNGDIKSLEEAKHRSVSTGADGTMVGRGVFGNPWFFNPTISQEDISTEERLRALLEHTRLYEEKLPMKPFAIMKKHFKAYVTGFDGAKELRTKLMEEATDADAVDRILCEVV